MQMKIEKTNLKTLSLKITKMNEYSKKKQEIIQNLDDKLKSFIERLERLSEENNNLNYDIKEIFLKQKQVGMI